MTAPTWPGDYDVYMMEATVNAGGYTGFMLARAGIGNLKSNLIPSKPHNKHYDWVIDPLNPENPEAGHWAAGGQQWDLVIAALNDVPTLKGDATGTGAAAQRAFLEQYRALSKFMFRDVALNADVQVRMTGYEERHIEPADLESGGYGGWVMLVTLSEAKP